MTPGWGRKRCPRRLCSPPLCMPMPRPCLDSLEIPSLRPSALRRAPQTGIVPRCVQPSCDTKRPVCHCTDKNYCTVETCTNSTSCLQSQTLFCPYVIKRDKDEHNVCNGPGRQQESKERNYTEDFEKYEPTCDEALCEKLENCGVRTTSNDEELIPRVSYTPSVINQNAFSGMPPIVRRQVPFNNEIGGFPDEGISQRSHNFSEINNLSNINRCIQINMQNQTVSSRGCDTECSITPEVCCRGNEVPNSFSLSGLSQCKSNIVDKNNVPAAKDECVSFDATTERHDTTSHPNNLYSKTSEFQLNTRVSDINDNSGYSRDDVISLPDENNSNRNKLAINPCCKYSYDIPVSFEPRSEEQLNYPENGEFIDGLQKSNELSQQKVKQFSEQYENHAKRNPINSSPMQFAPQGSSRINIDSLRIRDNSQHILAQENDPSNFIPSTRLPLNTTLPYINKSSTNEITKTSVSGNNSTNQRRLVSESKNQFAMSNTPNNCCVSGATQGHLDSLESTCQKPTKFVTPPAAKIQPITSYTNPPKQFSGSQLNQVRFHDNSYINNANDSSNPEKHNQKSDKLWRSSKIQINDNTSKDMNTIQPTNSIVFDQNYSVICEGCKQGCCTHRVNETVNKSELPFFKKSKDVDCVCSKHELENIKCKKKPACLIEDGTTSCASTTCIVNQHLGCSCRYPPAFKQFSCTGNISGICNCNDKK